MTWDGEYTMQYRDDVSQNCISETWITLLTNVTPTSSIKEKHAEMTHLILISKGTKNNYCVKNSTTGSCYGLNVSVFSTFLC